MLGRTISHCKIAEKLGEGGRGVVYKADDTKLGRPVALKFLPASLTVCPEGAARFEQEARAISALNHPHIATLFEFVQADGYHFLVFEYLPGGTLKAELAGTKSRADAFSIEDVLDFTLPIAEGLEHAHQHGVIHSDVKTENALLAADCSVKNADFELARLEGEVHLTHEGALLGTIAYKSPEQAEGKKAGLRSGIFSFAMVLYVLRTAALPFADRQEATLRHDLIHTTAPASPPTSQRWRWAAIPGARSASRPRNSLVGLRGTQGLANRARIILSLQYAGHRRNPWICPCSSESSGDLFGEQIKTEPGMKGRTAVRPWDKGRSCGVQVLDGRSCVSDTLAVLWCLYR